MKWLGIPEQPTLVILRDLPSWLLINWFGVALAGWNSQGIADAAPMLRWWRWWSSEIGGENSFGRNRWCVNATRDKCKLPPRPRQSGFQISCRANQPNGPSSSLWTRPRFNCPREERKNVVRTSQKLISILHSAHTAANVVRRWRAAEDWYLCTASYAYSCVSWVLYVVLAILAFFKI